MRLDPGVVDDRPELLFGHLLSVALENPGLRFHHLAKRPERDALPIREAAAVRQEVSSRSRSIAAYSSSDEPALADPGNADERHQLGRALLTGPLESPGEQLELPLATDREAP